MKTHEDTPRRRMRSLVEWAENQISRIRKFDIWDWAVLASILAYGLIFSYFTILKHNVFQSYAWDLGIFDQSMYTTLHGRFLYYTVDSFLNLSGCFFAQHISPILLVILPIYAIQTSATTLLVIKSFALALGALPLYLIARMEFENKKMGLLLVLTFLLYPALQASNWFDFQPQVFLPLFVLSSYYFFRRESWKLYFLFVILALMIEEHIAIIVFVPSLFMFIDERKTFFPALKNRQVNKSVVLVTTMVVCVCWFISAFFVKGTFPINQQFITRYQASETFSVLGVKGDPLLLPLQVLANPQNAWNALMYDYTIKFFYIIVLFGPLLFIPFGDKLTLGIFALLAPFLLSNYWPYYTLGAHYPLYVLPLIFIAFVNAFKHFHPTTQTTVLKITLLVTIIFVASTSPISPVSKPFDAANERILWYPDINFSPTVYTESLNRLLRLIPSDASVLTQNHLFPHLSARSNAYVIPPIGHFDNDTEYLKGLIDKSEYILLDLFDWDSLTGEVYDQITQSSSHGFYALGAKSLLFKRDFHEEPLFEGYEENKVYVAHRDLVVSGYGVVTPDSSTDTGNSVMCPEGTKGIITFGPYTYLLPGAYEVTFAVKAGNHEEGYLGTLDISDNFGQPVLAKRDIYGFELQLDSWTNFTLMFTSTQLRRNIEYRTFSNGVADVYIDKVFVKRVSPNATQDFGSETLAPGSIYLTPGRHLVIDSGNKTDDGFFVHYRNSMDEVFWYGPYESLNEGNYTVEFVMKVFPLPQTTDDKIITLQVSADAGAKSIAEYEAYSSSFLDTSENSTWKRFTIDFEVKTPLVQVEFRGLGPSPNYDIYLAYVFFNKR